MSQTKSRPHETCVSSWKAHTDINKNNTQITCDLFYVNKQCNVHHILSLSVITKCNIKGLKGKAKQVRRWEGTEVDSADDLPEPAGSVDLRAQRARWEGLGRLREWPERKRNVQISSLLGSCELC